MEGYVWNEYLDKIYSATISDGTTTAAAVYWIDIYGESAATPGYHYNKVEIELNNGTSRASNKAAVNRYAAFFNEDGSLKAGTYTINVYAEGYDTVTAVLSIVNPVSLDKAKVTLKTTSYTYDGKAKKPAVTVVCDGKTLKAGTDYTVQYSDNKKVGKAVVTVTGIGYYEGTVTKNFTINPAKTTVSKVTSAKKGKMTVKWKKNAQADGYEIQYSLKKNNASGNKTVKITKKAATSKTISGLKAGKTYYVRIRAYSKVSGKTCYSDWSASKKVTVKKK